MAVFKCAHIFTAATGKVGWSETLYLNQSSLASAISLMNALAFGRSGFLWGASVVGFRVVLADVRGAKATTGSYTSFPGHLNELVNDYNNGALVNMVPASGSTRRMFLRGLPDSMVAGGRFIPTNAYMIPFNIWSTAIAGNGCVRQRQLDVTVQSPIITIDGAGLATVASTAGIVPPALATFHQCRDSSGRLVTGTWRIKSVDATHFQIGGWLQGRTAVGGTWFQTTFIYPPISSVGVPKLGERKAGRPFDLPRGLKRLVGRGLPRTG